METVARRQAQPGPARGARGDARQHSEYSDGRLAAWETTQNTQLNNWRNKEGSLPLTDLYSIFIIDIKNYLSILPKND